MMKLNLEPVGMAIGKVCKTVAYGLLMFGPSIAKAYCSEKKINRIANYSDAVDAILQSDMWRGEKPEAISSLKRYAEPSYYETIILIANDDDIWRSDKLGLIKKLSEE